MFKFDRIDFQRFAVAAVGALILSTTAVTAAVGPAMAVEPASASQAQSEVAGEARA